MAPFSDASELIVNRGTGGAHLGDITGNLEVLGVVLVDIDILPRVELALQAEVVVGLLGVRDIDAYALGT